MGKTISIPLIAISIYHINSSAIYQNEQDEIRDMLPNTLKHLSEYFRKREKPLLSPSEIAKINQEIFSRTLLMDATVKRASPAPNFPRASSRDSDYQARAEISSQSSTSGLNNIPYAESFEYSDHHTPHETSSKSPDSDYQAPKEISPRSTASGSNEIIFPDFVAVQDIPSIEECQGFDDHQIANSLRFYDDRMRKQFLRYKQDDHNVNSLGILEFQQFYSQFQQILVSKKNNYYSTIIKAKQYLVEHNLKYHPLTTIFLQYTKSFMERYCVRGDDDYQMDAKTLYWPLARIFLEPDGLFSVDSKGKPKTFKSEQEKLLFTLARASYDLLIYPHHSWTDMIGGVTKEEMAAYFYPYLYGEAEKKGLVPSMNKILMHNKQKKSDHKFGNDRTNEFGLAVFPNLDNRWLADFDDIQYFEGFVKLLMHMERFPYCNHDSLKFAFLTKILYEGRYDLSNYGKLNDQKRFAKFIQNLLIHFYKNSREIASSGDFDKMRKGLKARNAITSLLKTNYDGITGFVSLSRSKAVDWYSAEIKLVKNS